MLAHMTRGRLWLLAAGCAFVGLALLPIIFGETRRVVGSVCTRCGVTQYHVYRVLWGVWLPTGTAASGGRPDCAHEIRRVGRGTDLLRP